MRRDHVRGALIVLSAPVVGALMFMVMMTVGVAALLAATGALLWPLWMLVHAPLALGAVAVALAAVGAAWGLESNRSRGLRTG